MSVINALKLRLFKVTEYYYSIQVSDTSLSLSVTLLFEKKKKIASFYYILYIKLVNLVLNSTKIYIFYASTSKAARCMITLSWQNGLTPINQAHLWVISSSFTSVLVLVKIHQPRTNCNGAQNTFENYQWWDFGSTGPTGPLHTSFH